ncbi:macro domain-containing protein [Azospira inquinata]|uniref:Macro domain-containing protein n=1 Tax=Azospira inquinata TaxID=2785627 RepID=A0A975SNW5_9RHOO|nr:macro domain-containing protein [Azospira inquinata]QWT45428.1 macro domain-containing protein [Azospira inquinata]QWT49244.1 macro domain-containing protein [Azospira inquinata]
MSLSLAPASLGPDRLVVWQGDITALAVAAIVNAANPGLTPGGGVCGAIHRAAGPELAEACRRVAPCPTGEVRLTPGFRLPAPWVIHGVGPVWQGGARGEAEQLAACYRQACQLAAARGFRSLAFPAISCGIYGYPPEAGCALGVREVKRALAAYPVLEKIVLVAFGPDMEACWRHALATADFGKDGE